MKKILFLWTFVAFLSFQGTSYAIPYDQYTATGHETFWTIAQRAGVSASNLTAINPLVDSGNIWKGLMINLPNGHKPMTGLIPASEVSRQTYTVRSNDTFWYQSVLLDYCESGGERYTQYLSGISPYDPYRPNFNIPGYRLEYQGELRYCTG
jgi:hypothetical protein